ncbi:POL5 protein, partial [Vespula maculifrons]
MVGLVPSNAFAVESGESKEEGKENILVHRESLKALQIVHLPGFLRELHSTGGCAEAATATEGLPPEAASLTAFGKPAKDGKSDKEFMSI